MASSARIDELRKKFDENPRRYFAPLANEYRKAGDLEQAIFICQEYLPQQPGHMSGHIVYGQALFEMQRREEAQVVFETALSLDPENLIALRHLGDIARQAGDTHAARVWYQRVLEADPRNEEIAQIMMALLAEPDRPAVSSSAPTPLSTPAVAESRPASEMQSQEPPPPTAFADEPSAYSETPAPRSPYAPPPPPPPHATPSTVAGDGREFLDLNDFALGGVPLRSIPTPAPTPAVPDAPPAPNFAAAPDVGSDVGSDVGRGAESDVGDEATESRDAGADDDVVFVELSVADAITLPWADDAQSADPSLRATVNAPSNSAPNDGVGGSGAGPLGLSEPLEVETDPLTPRDEREPSVFETTPTEPSTMDAFLSAAGNSDEHVADAHFEDDPFALAAVEESKIEPVAAQAPTAELQVAQSPAVDESLSESFSELLAEPANAPANEPANEPANAPADAPSIELATDLSLGLPDDGMSPAMNDELETPTSEGAVVGAPVSAPSSLPANAFVTETMADLYMQQGHLEMARDILARLAEQRPADGNLRERLRAVEERLFGAPPSFRGDIEVVVPSVVAIEPAGPTIREFLKELTVKRVGSRVRAADSEGQGSEPTAEREATGSDDSVRGSIDALFSSGGASSATDVAAADAFQQAFASDPQAGGPLDGQPAHRASGELSLDHVFRPSTPARPAEKTDGFSFDQFFAGDAADPAPDPAADGAAGSSTDDIAQFNAWLNGLKKT